MQSKMASRNRLLNRAYQRVFALWIPLFGWSVRHVPLRLLYAMGAVIMRTFLFLNPSYTRAVRGNGSQLLGEAPDSVRVRKLVRRMAYNHGRYWIDFFYWSERAGAGGRRVPVQVENGEALDRCARAGRGIVALTAHLGNWEMGGLILGGRAGEMAVIYVPDRFAILEKYRSEYRRSSGIIEIPMTNDPLSALGALRILRAGGVVAVQGDRDFNDSGIPVPFFGRMAWFPKGPAVLSLVSRSPILPVFILRAEDARGAGSGGFRVIVCDPIEPAGKAGDEAAIESMVRKCVAVMERVIRAHPDQWYCFYPFWDHPSRAERGRPPEEPGGPADRMASTAAR